MFRYCTRERVGGTRFVTEFGRRGYDVLCLISWRRGSLLVAWRPSNTALNPGNARSTGRVARTSYWTNAVQAEKIGKRPGSHTKMREKQVDEMWWKKKKVETDYVCDRSINLDIFIYVRCVYIYINCKPKPPPPNRLDNSVSWQCEEAGIYQ